MLGCPLKFILGFYGIFYIKVKYSYTIMYECEKSPWTYELSYIGLFNFFHLILFHVNVICKSSIKSPYIFFSFFGTPIVNGPNNSKKGWNVVGQWVTVHKTL